MGKSLEQIDEIACLKMILDSMVDNQSLCETADVDIDGSFLEALRDSVDSILGNNGGNPDIRTKMMKAFDALIEKHAKQLKL